MEQVGSALSLAVLGGAKLLGTDGILAVLVAGAARHLRCRIGQTWLVLTSRLLEMPR